MTNQPKQTPVSVRPGRMVLWYGQLTTQRRLMGRAWMMVGAPTFWLLFFLFLPSLVMVALAFAQRGEYGDVIWSFSLGNFKRLLGMSSFGWTIDLYRILWRTTLVSVLTTVISLMLAYPLAFYIATRKASRRYMMLALIMVPFCTNMVIRVHGWKLLLSNNSPVVRLLGWLGLVTPDTPLYPSFGAILIGMVSCMLPFAVLPLYTNVERLDWSIVEAAQDLYAGKWRTFVHAIVPQTIPGLMVAIILTFIPAMGMYVVSDSLGAGT